MTMKHKIEKYRIKGLTSGHAKPDEKGDSHQPRRPQQASQSVPNEPEKPPKKSAQTPDNQDLEAVRQEGLNARQLRTARRTAQKHRLPFTTDYEAVLQLRRQGIDPFEWATVLDMAANTSSSKKIAAKN